MAAIGSGWAADAWIEAGWVSGAWAAVEVAPTQPAQRRDGGAGKRKGPPSPIEYVWPPPGYEQNIEEEIKHQEAKSESRRRSARLKAAAVKVVEARAARDLAQHLEILDDEAFELIQRRKAAFMEEATRRFVIEAAIEDDEEALLAVLLAMD